VEDIFTGKGGLIVLLGGIISIGIIMFILITIKHILLVKKLNNGKDRIYTDIKESNKVNSKHRANLIKILKHKERKFSLLLSKYLNTHSDSDEKILIECYNHMVELRKELNGGIVDDEHILKEGSLDIICKTGNHVVCDEQISRISNILKRIDKQLTNKR